MLKFFRKIRQQLLLENSFSKYLLYAAGEILLVVIGILLALHINNWNEAKKDRKVENQALINLKLEFDENHKRLQMLMDIKQNQEDQCRAYLELVTNDTIPIAKKVSTPRQSTYAGTWGATNAVLNSLLSTGGIDKIENDSLKFLLSNWPVLVNRYVEREKRFDTDIENLFAFENVNIPISVVKKGTHRDVWPGSYFPNNMKVVHDSLNANMVVNFQYQNYIANVPSSLFGFDTEN